MVLFSFEFTKISCKTINARTLEYLLKFQHDVTFSKILYFLHETGLYFTLDNCGTSTTILTRSSSACITTRHLTPFTMIFCNSILLTALTSYCTDARDSFSHTDSIIFALIIAKIIAKTIAKIHSACFTSISDITIAFSSYTFSGAPTVDVQALLYSAFLTLIIYLILVSRIDDYK